MGFMLHDSLGIIVYIIYYITCTECQMAASCHGETWVYMTEADSHVLRRSPLIGPRGAARLGMGGGGGSREPRGDLGSWELDFEREVLYERVYDI